MLLVILVLGGFGYYIMTPEERARVIGPLRVFGFYAVRQIARGAVLYVRALRARQRWALAIPAAAAGAMILILVNQAHLRQFADIGPDIELVLQTEARMASTYASAVEQFKLGAMSAEALAQHINRRIMPDLQVLRIRLMSLDRVRSEQTALLTQAKEYVRLRDESWRLRADALAKRNMAALKKADHAERASLAALNALEEARRSL
jgi:hypothetical protein